MNTILKQLIAALCIAMLTPLGALADDAHHKPKAATAAGADDLADGEVRKVDLEAGKVTLKHGDIKSLDMPAMTMVFRQSLPLHRVPSHSARHAHFGQ